MSSCARHSNTPSDRAVMAANKALAEKAADKKALEEEDKELHSKKRKETEEYEKFSLMKTELKRDEATATTYPGRSSHVSKALFAKEMLAVDARLETISKSVEYLSARVQTPPELKMEPKTAEPNHRNNMSKAKTRTQAATNPETPFWGIQIGAYKTKPGAKIAWGEFLAAPTSRQLSGSKVRYVPSKPLRNGRRLTLIIIDSYVSSNAANVECEALKGQGIDCVAYHVKP